MFDCLAFKKQTEYVHQTHIDDRFVIFFTGKILGFAAAGTLLFFLCGCVVFGLIKFVQLERVELLDSVAGTGQFLSDCVEHLINAGIHFARDLLDEQSAFRRFAT